MSLLAWELQGGPCKCRIVNSSSRLDHSVWLVSVLSHETDWLISELREGGWEMLEEEGRGWWRGIISSLKRPCMILGFDHAQLGRWRQLWLTFFDSSPTRFFCGLNLPSQTPQTHAMSWKNCLTRLDWNRKFFEERLRTRDLSCSCVRGVGCIKLSYDQPVSWTSLIIVLPTYTCTLDVRQLSLEKVASAWPVGLHKRMNSKFACFIKAKRKRKIFEFLDREILVDLIGERTLFTRENHFLPTAYLLSVEADLSKLMNLLLTSNLHLN